MINNIETKDLTEVLRRMDVEIHAMSDIARKIEASLQLADIAVPDGYSSYKAQNWYGSYHTVKTPKLIFNYSTVPEAGSGIDIYGHNRQIAGPATLAEKTACIEALREWIDISAAKMALEMPAKLMQARETITKRNRLIDELRGQIAPK